MSEHLYSPELYQLLLLASKTELPKQYYKFLDTASIDVLRKYAKSLPINNQMTKQMMKLDREGLKKMLVTMEQILCAFSSLNEKGQIQKK